MSNASARFELRVNSGRTARFSHIEDLYEHLPRGLRVGAPENGARPVFSEQRVYRADGSSRTERKGFGCIVRL